MVNCTMWRLFGFLGVEKGHLLLLHLLLRVVLACNWSQAAPPRTRQVDRLGPYKATQIHSYHNLYQLVAYM